MQSSFSHPATHTPYRVRRAIQESWSAAERARRRRIAAERQQQLFEVLFGRSSPPRRESLATVPAA
jgi:hypothetical protein